MITSQGIVEFHCNAKLTALLSKVGHEINDSRHEGPIDCVATAHCESIRWLEPITEHRSTTHCKG